MILVTETTSATLLRDLEQARSAGSSERCVYFRLAGLESRAEDWIEDVSAYLTDVIADPKCRIYLCEDGDVFIIATGLTRRKMAEVFVCVIPHLRPAPDPQGLATLFDVEADIHALLVIVQEKVDAIAAAQEVARRVREEEERIRCEREKRAILRIEITPQMRKSIQDKRNAHDRPVALLVDDDAFSRRIVRNVLGDGYNIHMGENGWESITTYLREAPDIVFLDIEMPDINGHDLLAKIFDIDPQAYVVMLSGHGHQDNVIRAIKRGAKGFIGKPFTREKIVHYLQSCPFILQRKAGARKNV